MKATLTIGHSELPAKVLDGFAEITQLIALARERAIQSVNTGIIDLYWRIGERISRKIAAAEWGMVLSSSWQPISLEASRGRGFIRANLISG